MTSKEYISKYATMPRTLFIVVSLIQWPLLVAYFAYTKAHNFYLIWDIFVVANTLFYFRKEPPVPFRSFFPLVVIAVSATLCTFLLFILGSRIIDIVYIFPGVFVIHVITIILLMDWLESAFRKCIPRQNLYTITLSITSTVWIFVLIAARGWLMEIMPPKPIEWCYSLTRYQYIDEHQWVYALPIIIWFISPILIVMRCPENRYERWAKQYMISLPYVVFMYMCIMCGLIISAVIINIDINDLGPNGGSDSGIMDLILFSLLLLTILMAMLHTLIANVVVWYIPKIKKVLPWKPSTP